MRDPGVSIVARALGMTAARACSGNGGLDHQTSQRSFRIIFASGLHEKA